MNFDSDTNVVDDPPAARQGRRDPFNPDSHRARHGYIVERPAHEGSQARTHALSLRLALMFALASVLLPGGPGLYLYHRWSERLPGEMTLHWSVNERMRVLIGDSRSIEALQASGPQLYANMPRATKATCGAGRRRYAADRDQPSTPGCAHTGWASGATA
jgi:hypothetical protein